MQPQPLIAVRDVPASRRWYQQLLGCASVHGGNEYEQLVDPSGTLILQLHAWDAHDHPHLGHPDLRPILEGPKVNPAARHREIWLRDPDGYVVVLASAHGDL